MQGAYLLSLTEMKNPLISCSLNTILQEKDYFCPDPLLDFSGRQGCFRILRCTTITPTRSKQEEVFSPLKLKFSPSG
jgi:hypothetical protein